MKINFASKEYIYKMPECVSRGLTITLFHKNYFLGSLIKPSFINRMGRAEALCIDLKVSYKVVNNAFYVLPAG